MTEGGGSQQPGTAPPSTLPPMEGEGVQRRPGARPPLVPSPRPHTPVASREVRIFLLRPYHSSFDRWNKDQRFDTIAGRKRAIDAWIPLQFSPLTFIRSFSVHR